MTISTDQGGRSAAENGAHPSAVTISAAGLRRVTPGTQKARKHAQAYRQPGAPRRSRAAILKVVKRAAAALGLKSAKMALLDQIFAASQPIDWSDEHGVGPVVWPSNAHLARLMGTSEVTISRHLGDLFKAGLISFVDGPTCRRHGKRDGEGRIIEARGIDLSPMAMRYEELRAIAEAAEAAGREKKQLRDRRSVLIKNIRSLIADAMRRMSDDPSAAPSLRQDWNRVHARLDVLRERRIGDVEELARQVGDMETLHDDADALYDKGFSVSDEASDLYENDNRGSRKCIAHTTTAPTPNSDICNQNGIAHKRRACPTHKGDNSLHEAAYGSMALEEKPPAKAQENKRPTVETDGMDHDPDNQSTVAQDGEAVAVEATDTAPNADDDVLQLSIGLLRDACPAIEGAAPGAFAHWQALRTSGPAICAGADINPQVFTEASRHLGPDIAIAAAAVTVQKAAMGTVNNPGAYLRTLTKRGRVGQLNIARSLHGLAEQNGRSHTLETPQEQPLADDPDDGRNPETTDQTSDAAATPADNGQPGRAERTRPAFPREGSIAYSHWADIVRQNAPEPTPDVDIVADAFRRFCRRNTIDTTSPNIERVFTTFARKWKERPWDTNG